MLTVVAQFTAKTANSEKAFYFLPLMSYSINKLKSHMLLTCINFMFFNFTWKKTFCSKKWWKAGPSNPPPSLSLRLWYRWSHWMWVPWTNRKSITETNFLLLSQKWHVCRKEKDLIWIYYWTVAANGHFLLCYIKHDQRQSSYGITKQ